MFELARRGRHRSQREATKDEVRIESEKWDGFASGKFRVSNEKSELLLTKYSLDFPPEFFIKKLYDWLT